MLALKHGYANVRSELIGFFNSVWFDELYDFLNMGIDPRIVRDLLGVPDELPQLVEVQVPMMLSSANWGVA
jgi:hypothetical protein